MVVAAAVVVEGAMEAPAATAATSSSYVRGFLLLKRALGLGRGVWRSRPFPGQKQLTLTRSQEEEEEGGRRRKRQRRNAFTKARILFFFLTSINTRRPPFTCHQRGSK